MIEKEKLKISASITNIKKEIKPIFEEFKEK